MSDVPDHLNSGAVYTAAPNNGDGKARHRVTIISHSTLQTQTLCELVKKETGLSCTCVHDYDAFTLAALKPALTLWDYQIVGPDGQGPGEMWAAIRSVSNTLPDAYMALFNVSAESNLEHEALNRGLHGVFFQTDSLIMLFKGILAILEGELWFSRKTLSTCLLSQQNGHENPHETIELTQREREVLAMLCSGASNDAIAQDLHISLSTVKKHTNNLYRKIKAENRTQAVLWAVKNL